MQDSDHDYEHTYYEMVPRSSARSAVAICPDSCWLIRAGWGRICARQTSLPLHLLLSPSSNPWKKEWYAKHVGVGPSPSPKEIFRRACGISWTL